MVSSIVLQQADLALGLGGPQGNGQQVRQGSRHWSYGLMIGAAVVGAITAVVAIIFSQIPIIAAGVMLALTGSIGAYYLKEFGMLSTLEDYTLLLSAKVNKIASTADKLERADDGLQKANKALNETIKERDKVIEKGNKKLNKTLDEFDQVAHKLEITEKRLANVIVLYQNLKKVTFKLTEQVAYFNSENDLLDENIDEFLDNIKKLDVNNDRLAGEI